MSAFLAFVRFRKGIVGETRRVVHLVPLPRDYFGGEDLAVTASVTALAALCGQLFRPGEAEQLNEPRGMPCGQCLTEAACAVPSERTPTTIPSASTTSEPILGVDACRV